MRFLARRITGEPLENARTKEEVLRWTVGIARRAALMPALRARLLEMLPDFARELAPLLA